ncbi:MAG: nucleoside hydrolase [Sedimentisphaeraceae bacterium JB056]
MNKIPVILDTDIGGDIDDTWALGMLINTPELDLKLISVVSHDVLYKAKIVCKFLERLDRADVPVAMGISTSEETGCQEDWVQDYSVDQYPGNVYDDAIDRIAEIVTQSEETVTIICIGTMTNMAAFADKYPDLVKKIKIVAMAGSIYKDECGRESPIPECNVVWDIPAAQTVFSSQWDITLAPLDVGVSARIYGNEYAAVRESDKIIPQMIIEQYENWTRIHPELGGNPQQFSSKLWDTVAVYLASKREFIELRNIPLVVTDKGYTKIDPANGKNVFVGLSWKDLPGFQKYLASTLVS